MTSQPDQKPFRQYADDLTKRRRWALEDAHIRQQLAEEAATRKRVVLWAAFVVLLVTTTAVSLVAVARLS